MTKLQKTLTEQLIIVVNVLEKNNINYWLAFGSVLGATRHGGFIPWDDDIDIYINGKDYNRVIEAFANEKDGSIVVHDFSNASKYPYVFPKSVDTRTVLIEKRFHNNDYVCGIYIDIFPVFSVSNNAVIRKVDQIKRYLNYCIVESHYYDSGLENRWYIKFASKILKHCSCLKAQNRIKNRYLKGIDFSKRYVQDCTKFTNEFLHLSEHFNGYDKLSFEGAEYRVPSKHEQYLKKEYGDYMQLPPVEKRGKRHSFEFLQYSDGTVEK